MSTRSRIGIMNPDGSIDSIYHHYDGYPQWLGVKLKKNYTDSASIRQALIDQGDLSCIESDTDWNRKELDEPIVLSYKMRGEDCPAAHHAAFLDFLYYDTIQTDFSYLWNPEIKIWTCWRHSWDSDLNKPLKAEIVFIPDAHPKELAQ